ncbi:PROTEIN PRENYLTRANSFERASE ALPHA SUBUNIT REPEAT-CONTAINING PROTEIN 1 [Salix koriyanagi]|uniref:PROTEIN PRENYLTRANSFERASE ALPHA SUBUNIT REPEAT-CONTAINING PROTEIN 1 n=1 Tax=Salix koriyanagi TaxID=2511006 RepID=A0A9Q0VZ54_9ROSI|nr:PROTEIN PRENYLTRANSFERASE ALPHA SUBUNIT REPEAT-CONTAINING PROTEIN 1 [Salix koriyanagi]
MREESMISKGNSLNLLDEFELILESDPLIDEVGFIHPSQFVTLNKEATSSLKHEDANFWSRDHKLAISTDVLLPLYNAAKDAFMHAISQYKRHGNLSDASGYASNLESEAMKHSKALLLLSCDFGTAWNFRKLIVSKKQKIMLFSDELLLSALVLSYSPKSEKAWCHRRWVIKMIAGKCSTLQDIAGKESELVEKIAERSKMNYRAWNHRCWLVSYMTTEQVLHELKKSRNWAGLHVADNSCFHYRTRLMLRIMEEHCHKLEDGTSDENNEIYQIWQEELDWIEALIKRYVGREALWLHRRFLSLSWIRHFTTTLGDTSNYRACKSSINGDIGIFMDNELHLANSCSTIPDNDFEDFQAQAMYSATYILWLTKQISDSQGIELPEKPNLGSLETMLNMACPERSFLWDILTRITGKCDEVLKENNC